MKNRIKSYGKDAMGITVTGIGLGVGASVLGGVGGNVGAVSKLSAGLSPIASLTTAKHTIGILGDINKDVKKKVKW